MLFVILHGSPIYIASLYHIANGFTGDYSMLFKIWSIIAMPYAYVGTSDLYLVLNRILKPITLGYVICALTFKLFQIEKRIVKYGRKGLVKIPRSTKQSKMLFEQKYGVNLHTMISKNTNISEVDRAQFLGETVMANDHTNEDFNFLKCVRLKGTGIKTQEDLDSFVLKVLNMESG